MRMDKENHKIDFKNREKNVEEKTLATNLQSRSCLYESAVPVY